MNETILQILINVGGICAIILALTISIGLLVLVIADIRRTIEEWREENEKRN